MMVVRFSNQVGLELQVYVHRCLRTQLLPTTNSTLKGHARFTKYCACPELCISRSTKHCVCMRLPRKLHFKNFKNHKALCLSRDLHLKVHKVPRLPALQGPQNTMPDTRTALQGSQSAAPGTKPTRKGPQSTAPATKPALELQSPQN